MKKLLSILALALCFVACQNEGVENATNGDLANVVLTVDAPELSATRADGDANTGKNSGFGAIDFFNDADWANFDVRYILEVYDANDDGTGEPIYRERLVNYLDKYAPTNFELRLVPNREYKFVVFADFVEQGSTDDLYYNTADLRNITANTNVEGWNAMNEARDAYFVTENVNVTTSLNKTLTLTRPFAKLRVIATDLDYIAGYSKPGYVSVKYHTEALYKSFNAVNGNLNDTQLTGTELEYSFEVYKDAPYTEGYDANAAQQTLFADYLLARDDQQMPVNFTLSVYESKGGRLIKEIDYNTQIPVQRNHLTTIIGDILTTQANISIIINDDFEGEMINPSMEVVAAPVVKATAEGNTVTLAWEAVEGAAKYYTRLVAEGNLAFEETTELTKVYENLAWETEYTFEVYAMSEKGIVSESVFVKATTEAKPITYNIYLENKDNWEAVYFYAWGDYTTSEWPGEAMTKTTVDEVEYYVYTLPSEVNGKTINFLFNNGGNGKQTADIKDVVVDKNYFYSNYVEAPAVDTILYLQPNTNWNADNARFAAYFFGAGETWVDMTLVEGETNIYSVTVPAGGYPSVIFCRMNPSAAANNWNNKWNQTGDLTIPTDDKVLFVVPENTWDNATNDNWTTYSATEEPVQPVALATPVVTAAVDVNVITLTWEAVEGAAHYTVQVDDDVEEVVEATTYTFTGDYEFEYTFTVKAIAADTEKNTNSEAAVVTVTTEAEPVVEPTYTTVAEFLAAEEDDTIYTLNGTITSVTQTTYGNFYLMDDTGEVLIYGLCSPEGTAQYWAASGAKVGDDITVKTVRTSYGGAPQGKNAIFVDLVSPGTRAFWTFDATAVSFASAADVKTINVSLYNAKEEVKVASDNAQFTAEYADGKLTITALENTTPDKIEGIVTITCGALSQEISVSQNGASTGDKEEVTATLTFDDKTKRTEFSTASQTWTENGITFVNEKNKSTNNVADYAKPVRCYQGSRIIVSVDGEIATIVFDCNSSSYATALKNSIKSGEVSVSSDKVTVKLNGEASFTIDQLTAQSRIDAVTVTYMK